MLLIGWRIENTSSPECASKRCGSSRESKPFGEAHFKKSCQKYVCTVPELLVWITCPCVQGKLYLFFGLAWWRWNAWENYTTVTNAIISLSSHLMTPDQCTKLNKVRGAVAPFLVLKPEKNSAGPVQVSHRTWDPFQYWKNYFNYSRCWASELGGLPRTLFARHPWVYFGKDVAPVLIVSLMWGPPFYSVHICISDFVPCGI